MIGKTINGFTLQRKLGEGGMAEVWYAENEIGKPAAVKILSASLSNNEQIVERFHNEALVMVKLDHPNIRQVYGYGYIDNRHCIVMEYLEGDDLEALLKKGRRFTDEELRKWWNQIISALNYTHSKGIVHRDIKPSNIFLDNWGNVKLLDFGIAKLKESMSMTRTGTMMGTLMYMSPEQVRDTKNIDYRTDIYSLAVTFAQLASGTAPYDATNSDDYTIRKGIVELPFDLSAVPAAWQGFLAPYLEKDPQMRPALRPFEEVKATVSVPPTPIVSTQEVHEEKTLVAEKQETFRMPKPSEEGKETKTPGKKGLFWIIAATVLAVSTYSEGGTFTNFGTIAFTILIWTSVITLMLIPLLKKRKKPQTQTKLWQLIALGVMIVLVVLYKVFFVGGSGINPYHFYGGDEIEMVYYSFMSWAIRCSYLIMLIPPIIMAARGIKKGKGMFWIGVAVPIIVTAFVLFYVFDNLQNYAIEYGSYMLLRPRLIIEFLWVLPLSFYMFMINKKNEGEATIHRTPFFVGIVLSLIVCLLFMVAYLYYSHSLFFFNDIGLYW